MKALSGKELTKVLERHGWSLLRVHGSHHIYGKPGRKARLSVPVHGNRPLKVGLLRHLLKTAEIRRKNCSR
jgi:predicted RNA binding protein YcfA (HicA-like mRNA interferase family)